MEWEKATKKKARMIDDFLKEDRTTHARDCFEVYFLRAIDELYGYSFSAILRDNLYPQEITNSESEVELLSLLQRDQKEHSESSIKLIELFKNGLSDDAVGDVEAALREVVESSEIKAQLIELLATKINQYREAA